MRPTGSTPTRHQGILVVEDDEVCAEVLEDILTMLGETPVLARSAEEARALFHQHHPRAVITDNSMPGRSGLWLAQWIKHEAPKVVVIMLSADPPLESHIVCDVVLPKPVLLTYLKQALVQAGALSRS